ncbi:hypothetical protein [Saccharopolyspora hattusasensis]|uniref:hypothetical protein n=1 Tax=Saccharopolyspora hattusasensis TaxID=1128679 RepID=UPI003D9791F8
MALDYGLPEDEMIKARKQTRFMGRINVVTGLLLAALFWFSWGTVETLIVEVQKGSSAGLGRIIEMVDLLVIFAILVGVIIRLWRNYAARYYAMVVVLETLDHLAWQRNHYRYLLARPSWVRTRHHRASAQRYLQREAYKVRRLLGKLNGDKIDCRSNAGTILGRWMCWAAEDLDDFCRADYLVYACLDTVRYLLNPEPPRRLSLQYPPRQAELNIPALHKRISDVNTLATNPVVFAGMLTLLGAIVALVNKAI